MRFLFGNRVGRHNATQVRESWLWGPAADMIELERDWGNPGLRAQQERQKTLLGGGRRTRPLTEQESGTDSWDGTLSTDWPSLMSPGCQAMTGTDCRPLDQRLSMMIPEGSECGHIFTLLVNYV